ncbi:MAG: sigma-70 family RNA polymerase sigma factor [Cyclobacteriaceae bacterium]|nr:sigma-70 family RNA polymerase sigma factor [Cyclobacteriaceae bacterium]
MLSIHKSMTVTDLLDGCRRGDPKAQRALYERVAPRMLGVCFRYVHDRAEAEHVMVGGMVKVFGKLNQYLGEGSFEGWIRRIMINESLMYIRKNKALYVEVDIESVGLEPEYDELREMESDELVQMIGELPMGYRTVFNLYAIEGYNHQEISELLGISESTSKSQLCRARKLLQTRLATLHQRELTQQVNHGNS